MMNNLLPLCKVKYKGKTHYLNQIINMEPSMEKINKQKVKACQSPLN